MLPENMKEQVKKRIKAKVLKHWKKNLEEILEKPEERLELYEDAWNMRENNNFSAIPNAVILRLLIATIGHWNKTHHKGIDIHEENQSLHTISAR